MRSPSQGLQCPPPNGATVGIFRAQRITGFSISASDAVTIVAALVFIAGLLAVWQMLSGAFAHRYVFDLSAFLNVFGLAAGPALLTKRGPGYWTSLIILTANAILSVAGLMLLMFVAWEKFTGNGTPWALLDSGITAVVVVEVLLSLWGVKMLRRSDVRGLFGT